MAAAVALATAGGLTAQEEAAEKPGPAPGARAPEFKLKDQNGREVALSELRKKGNVALVFYRSADW
jgi:cytochrome oxidase Cu insertion factor (SCO1/SenC/PrrC family)